jgi:CheY-like chemotaxis protein
VYKRALAGLQTPFDTQPNRMNETSKKIRILMAGDQSQMGYGLASLLNHEPDITVVAEVADGRVILDLCSKETPDIVLMDLQMPGIDSLEVLRRLNAQPKPARVIGMTAVFQEEEALCALEAGARGYFLKNLRPNDLLEAVRAVHRGCRWVALVIEGRFVAWLGHGEAGGQEFGVMKFLPHAGRDQKGTHAGVRSQEAVISHLKILFERLGVHEDSRAAIRAMLK